MSDLDRESARELFLVLIKRIERLEKEAGYFPEIGAENIPQDMEITDYWFSKL